MTNLAPISPNNTREEMGRGDSPNKPDGSGIAYYEVYFNHPLNRPFTYRYSQQLSEVSSRSLLYHRVLVPLRGKTVVGFVTSEVESPTAFKVKDIIAVIDRAPVLSPRQVQLATWIANQYLSSLGEALALFFSFTPPKQPLITKRVKRDNLENHNKSQEPIPVISSELAEELRTRIVLNEEQCTCFDTFKTALADKAHGVFLPALVHGVTGSGKTYFYLRLVLEVILTGKQALILVPEITLIFQIDTLVKVLFPELRREVYHSKLSDKARTEVKQSVAKGGCNLVIATRSGFFLPFKSLGIIVMDEEHENSYKNNASPRYQLKQIAYYWAEKLAIPLVMVSATPSVELYYQTSPEVFNSKTKNNETPRVNSNEKKKKSTPITLFKLKERYAATTLPEVTLLAATSKSERSVGENEIPPEIYRAVFEELSNNRQVIFYINQRGYSSMVYCKSCKTTEGCPNCDITLTYHKKNQYLSCHYCGYRIQFKAKCTSCGSEELRFVKGGTENFYEQLSARFQNFQVERFDSDHTRTVKQIQAVLKDFREQQINILVGTQMLIKGHDFKNVGLVVVLFPENYLLLPDYRSQERMFSHLMQVSGRAGRDARMGKGRMLIVTRMPELGTLRAARAQSYENFYEREIEARKVYGYPPFVKLINLVLRGRKEEQVVVASNYAKAELEKIISRISITAQVLGPSPCLLERSNNYYRWNILVKVAQQNRFLTALEKSELLPPRSTGVYLEIDVSPVDLF